MASCWQVLARSSRNWLEQDGRKAPYTSQFFTDTFPPVPPGSNSAAGCPKGRKESTAAQTAWKWGTSQPVTVAPQSTVPRVVGYQLARAIGMLRQSGLVPLVRQVPSVAPNGRVIGQNPRAGAKEAKDGRVQLDVSLQPLVVIPNVVGMQGITASHTLIADHLHVSLRYVPSRQPPRTVIAQYPTAGGRVKRATSIEINISSGAPSRPTDAGASGPTGAGATGPTSAGPTGPSGTSTG